MFKSAISAFVGSKKKNRKVGKRDSIKPDILLNASECTIEHNMLALKYADQSKGLTYKMNVEYLSKKGSNPKEEINTSEPLLNMSEFTNEWNQKALAMAWKDKSD